MSRIDELPPGQPQNEPRKLVPENKDQQLHFALSIAEHLARTLDEERALRSGIVQDYQKLTEEHAVAVARAENTETELNAFLGDIEALLPADCRNSIAGRLQSVRAAVGFLAQTARDAEVQRHGEAEQRCYDLRAELERVKAERDGWDTEAKRLEDKLVEYRVWAGDRSGTTNPEEYTDEELRQGVDKASLMRLPLSDEQRIELADAARKAQYPGLKLKDFALIDGERQAEWLASVDAIAPRIARVGVELRELSDEEILAVINTREVKPGETVMQMFRSVHNAILAAAQCVAVEPPTMSTATIDTNAPIAMFTPDSQRWRKLTDGEQGLLVGLCDVYRKTPSGDSWRAILACVESLLAPHDETRVALGEAYLETDDVWRIDRESYAFGHDRDDAITSALSASPGDKFEFSVVARRVEK